MLIYFNWKQLLHIYFAMDGASFLSSFLCQFVMLLMAILDKNLVNILASNCK